MHAPKQKVMFQSSVANSQTAGLGDLLEPIVYLSCYVVLVCKAI